MAYVYRHIRLDKNEPFYVGIGKHEQDGEYPRAYNLVKEGLLGYRSEMWKNIVVKTEVRVDILFENMTWEEAKEKEKEFIALYGRKDSNTGTLVNQTDGGDGWRGHGMKEETKEKIRQYQLSLEKKGKPGRKWSPESIEKRSNTVRGTKRTEEQKAKMKKPKLNKANYSYPKNKIACINCGYMAQPAAIKRWHNENCKNKN
jgi:hypothetical protein